MPYRERKKAYNLGIVIALTLSISIIFLQFFENPYINPAKDPEHLSIILDFLFKGTVLLITVIVCISLVVYACAYYNRLHSRGIGLLKLAGCNTLQIVMYQLVQMMVVITIATVVAIISSLLWIPILQKIAYYYLGIHQPIFFYTMETYLQAFFLVLLLVILVVFMQTKYTIQTNIPSLLKNNTLTAYCKRKDRVTFLSYSYLVFYLIGVTSAYMGTLSQGLILPSCLCALGVHGMIQRVIPERITKKMKTKELKASKYLVYSNYSLLLQQMKSLLFLIMFILIILSTMTLVSFDNKQYQVLFHLTYVLSNCLLSFTLANRFKINRQNKKQYLKNLYRLGLDEEQIIAIAKQEIKLVYYTVFVLGGLYLGNMVAVFTFEQLVSIPMASIIILEFIVPFIITMYSTLYEEKRSIVKWKK